MESVGLHSAEKEGSRSDKKTDGTETRGDRQKFGLSGACVVPRGCSAEGNAGETGKGAERKEISQQHKVPLDQRRTVMDETWAWGAGCRPQASLLRRNLGGEWDTSAYAVGSGFHASMQTCDLHMGPCHIHGGSGQGGGAVVFFQWNSVRYTKNPCAMQNATDSIQ
jgi:hypothetical protein